MSLMKNITGITGCIACIAAVILIIRRLLQDKVCFLQKSGEEDEEIGGIRNLEYFRTQILYKKIIPNTIF